MGERKTGSRRGRRTAGLLAGLAALALLVIAGPRLVPGDRLAARAAEALGAAIGARVSVERAEAMLLGGPGLRLYGVRLDAGSAWQARLESAEVALAVAPLLGRRLVVDRLVVRGPEATTVAAGRTVVLTDFALDAKGLGLDLADHSEGAAAPRPGAGGAATLASGLGGKMALEAAGLSVGMFALAAITAEVRPAVGRFTLSSLVARCGGGDLAGEGWLDLGSAPATWEASIRLEGVDAAAMLGEWAPDVASRLDVRLEGDVRAGGQLAAAGPPAGGNSATPGAVEALAALRADARLGGGEGLLKAGDWLAGAGSYLGDRQDLVDVRLSAARLVARLEKGRCLVDTLTLRGPDTDWDLAGMVDVVAPGVGSEPALDLGVHLKLPPGFTPELGSLRFFAEALRDPQGRINLDLAVRGPLAEPAVTLDLVAMSRRLQRK